MSLPSPISIGDAIALSNVAYDIAKAFLPGGTSAQEDFKELHGLLCSLTHSLQGLGEILCLKDESTRSGDKKDAVRDNTVSNILEILSNCNDILGKFKRFVENYSTLEQTSSSSSNPSSASGRRWPINLKRKWMNIQWTAESDNISALKQSLSLHIQALNLAISKADRLVIFRDLCTPRPMRFDFLKSCSSERESRSRERLEKRLEEIFDGMNANSKRQEDLQESSTGSIANTIQDLSLIGQPFSFKLFRGVQPGIGKEDCLLCPEATLETLPFSDRESTSATPGGVFRCLCSGHNPRHSCGTYTRMLRSPPPPCH